MALGRMLNGYADRYIQTGSAAPILHVATTVGFGGYVYHSLLHWLESSSAEKRFAQQTESLQSKIVQLQKEIEVNAAERKAALEELKKTKAGAKVKLTRRSVFCCGILLCWIWCWDFEEMWVGWFMKSG